MIEIIVPDTEYWDDKNQMFINKKGGKFTIEHSLVSISKWEAKWKKPFLSDKEKTKEESIDYIRQMTITQNVDDDLYYDLPASCLEQIKNYISDSKTATTFPPQEKQSKSKEVMTSELLYYYMFTAGINKECEKWHLSRLMALLQIYAIKNKEMEKNNGKRGKTGNHSAKPNMAKRAALNAERKQKLGTSG